MEEAKFVLLSWWIINEFLLSRRRRPWTDRSIRDQVDLFEFYENCVVFVVRDVCVIKCDPDMLVRDSW